MSDDVQSLIRRINVRRRDGDPTVAESAIQLAEQYPLEPRVWLLLAHIHEDADNDPATLEALTRVVEVAPKEPVGFYSRGSFFLKREEYDRAVADFTQGLVLCDELSNDYYRGSLHFHRAEALILAGKKAEALRDLAHLPDDYEGFTTDLRSKAELLALCADAISPGNDGHYTGPPIEPTKPEDYWQLPEEPDADETALALERGPEGLAKIDSLLLKSTAKRFRKVARVLMEAVEADDLNPTDALYCVYLRRLIGLADAGLIEGAGNLRRPPFSEVRLPEKD
jgi:tetratricopeptide (TPR) repeat protein